MSPSKHRSNLFIIFLLGSLSVISPFSIDMYLPAFTQAAKDFDTSTAAISLTLSSYFIGLAAGQLFYGPLLDRFGRKIPLCGGLLLYILSSLGCALAPSLPVLIVFRFLQALGGCGASVACLAMVRDFFAPEEGAKILSRLFLFISVSPLLAPTAGGFVILHSSWRVVFFILMAIVILIFAGVHFLLPESHQPDTSISLKPAPIAKEYLHILKHPRFITYALAGAFSFAGLFTYVAGSPIIFMEDFHLDTKTYSMIFALLATGFIGASQINVLLLRTFNSRQLFTFFLIIEVIGTLFFAAGAWFGWYGLRATLALFFLCLSCVGITYPNAAGTALMPFTKNAGSASALLGFLQLGIGAVISASISMFTVKSSFSVIAILAITSLLGLIILLIGMKRAEAATEMD